VAAKFASSSGALAGLLVTGLPEPQHTLLGRRHWVACTAGVWAAVDHAKLEHWGAVFADGMLP